MDAPAQNGSNVEAGTSGTGAGGPVAAEGSQMSWKKRFIIWGAILAISLVVIWALTIHDAIVKSDGRPQDALNMHGLIPRTKKGLIGVISAPFLHIGYEHVEADSLGLIILGTLMMLSSFQTLGFVTAFVWILSTLLTWCVGRKASIVGTGFVIFGWFGYLIITPFFKRPISLKAIALAAVTGILYGGIIFTVFPTDKQVAWEANLCSILSGVICAVGYWYLYLQVIAKALAKRNIRIPALPSAPAFNNPFSSKPPKSKYEDSSAFPQAQTGEVILPQAERNSTSFSQSQTNRLLDNRSSPFGSQEVTQQPSAYGNNPSEPDWLFNSQPAAAVATSNQPSWLNPGNNSTSGNNVEMASFPANQPQSQNQARSPSQASFNPFD